MDIFTALATFAIGFYRAKRETDQELRHNEAWFKLSMSIFGTVLVTFLGVFGAAGLAALQAGAAPWMAAMTALFAACGATAAAVLALWKLSSLTKGIPILAPMKVEEKVLLDGFAYTEPNPTKEGK